MPRLDVWLIETGQFSSRQAAKRAIKDGLVVVNGKKCKPSKQVSEKDTIEILSLDADFPLGYKKLKEINENLDEKLITPSCLALDIGSSAGGFLVYLAKNGANAVGIEVSKRFREELHALVEAYPQISVIFADAFELDPTIIVDSGGLDLLLVDVTTEPEGTLKLIERFTILLKKEGRMLAAFKSNCGDIEKIETLKETISQMGYEKIQEICLDEARQEIHIVAFHM
ncbi:MAG: S4 domain-containing protein [Candidatus Thorarchaeota archaeon]|jgi:23S rRNA (cytidine1920-2'-O)/16S rRNA (cytidine1409-2'-O)-methyltransferase